jgi:ABC-type multidrug transport system fused ATPase/permease subunit
VDFVLRSGELHFKNVTFSYTPDRTVLRSLSFHVRRTICTLYSACAAPVLLALSLQPVQPNQAVLAR